MDDLVSCIKDFLATQPVVDRTSLGHLQSLVQHHGSALEVDQRFLNDSRNDSRVGRYLAYQDPDYGFVIIVLVWPPGHETPIHDHGTWGIELVLQGELTVTQYSECAVKPLACREQRLAKGSILSHCPPDHDIHAVANCSNALAASMHIYGSELTENRQFVEGQGYVECQLDFDRQPGPLLVKKSCSRGAT